MSIRLLHCYLLLLLTFCLLDSFESEARTWSVFNDGSGDAPTIQAALDSVSSGDSILIHPGIYTENPHIYNCGELTICGVSDRQSAEIDLEGGSASLSGEEITILNLSVTNGDGIFVNVDHYRISNCIFSRIEDLNSEAILLWNNSNTTPGDFENNTVEDCRAGDCVIVANRIIARNNIFRNNYSNDNNMMYMGTLSIDNGNAIIENNIFNNNHGEHVATINAVANPEGDEIVITIGNNIFYQNSGLYLIIRNSIYPVPIENNVMYNNNVETVTIGIGGPDNYCNIFWNTTYWSDNFPESQWNLNVDPRFCDPENEDFTVNVESICLPENQPPEMSCGLIGIYGVGCPTATRATTWGLLKLYYRGK